MTLAVKISVPQVHDQVLLIVVRMWRGWKWIYVVLVHRPNFTPDFELLFANCYGNFGGNRSVFHNYPSHECRKLCQKACVKVAEQFVFVSGVDALCGQVLRNNLCIQGALNFRFNLKLDLFNLCG